SSITATFAPSSTAAWRTSSSRLRCSTCVSCEKLSRATFMTAWIIALIVSRPSQAGQIVEISLVLRTSRLRMETPRGGRDHPLYRSAGAAASPPAPMGTHPLEGRAAGRWGLAMWLNALAAVVLAACMAAGAWNGALATGLRIATLVFAYAAAAL